MIHIYKAYFHKSFDFLQLTAVNLLIVLMTISKRTILRCEEYNAKTSGKISHRSKTALS